MCAFLPDYGDPRAMLTDFGVRLLTRMAEPGTLALSRVVIAAAEKFPNIGRAFFEAGPLYGNQRLAGRLRELEQAGLLSVPDPERAAWHFFDLCLSGGYKRLLFGVVDSMSREDIEASVEAGVDVFLKAYGAQADGDQVEKSRQLFAVIRIRMLLSKPMPEPDRPPGRETGGSSLYLRRPVNLRPGRHRASCSSIPGLSS